MATFNLELTPFLQNSDYHLIQFCIQPQHQLTCNMSSPSVGSASPCLLETFPVEILEKIYVYSGNPSFALVNKHISHCLSSEFIRLQFCVPLFSGERGAWAPGKTRPEKLGRTHTLVFQQPWFSKAFARKVQREVMQLRKVQQDTGGHAMRHPERLMHHPSRPVRVEFLDQIPSEVLLGGLWDQAKVNFIRGLLNWGATIPTKPRSTAPAAMKYAICQDQYLAVRLLHNTGKVPFDHRHFQSAVLNGCEWRIVEMILESNQNQPEPFIDPFDRRIYKRAMELEWDGDPMGRQIRDGVVWKGNQRELPVATRKLRA